MISLGKYNTLKILRDSPFGMFLGGDGDESVLLPRKYVPAEAAIGDTLKVFVYADSEDRLVATTLTPKITLNQCAYLEVKAVAPVGAFLDWGLEKDLFVPFKEQVQEMQVGERHVVILLLDRKSNRLIASARIIKLIKTNPTFTEGDSVDLLICHKSELGWQVIIDKEHLGLLYHNEIFQPLEIGDQLPGFIKQIREDGKVDVTLQKQGYGQIESSQQVLLDKLRKNNGVLELTDKSTPEDIADKVQMSKKTFKKAVGHLYKQKIITITPNGIELL